MILTVAISEAMIFSILGIFLGGFVGKAMAVFD